MVRAANGWIVAALCTDMRAEVLEQHVDTLEGTTVSISKDDGRSWSPIEHVFEADRHHCNLTRLPNDDLVMTVIRRLDLAMESLSATDAVVTQSSVMTTDRHGNWIAWLSLMTGTTTTPTSGMNV